MAESGEDAREVRVEVSESSAGPVAVKDVSMVIFLSSLEGRAATLLTVLNVSATVFCRDEVVFLGFRDFGARGFAGPFLTPALAALVVLAGLAEGIPADDLTKESFVCDLREILPVAIPEGLGLALGVGIP